MVRTLEPSPTVQTGSEPSPPAPLYENLIFPTVPVQEPTFPAPRKRVQIGNHYFLVAPQGRRVVAFLIDWAILLGGFFVILGLAEATKSTDYYGNEHWPPAVKVILVLGWVAWFSTVMCYWWLQEASHHNATIGKRAMGLRVMRTDGTPLSLGQAAGRDFARWLSYVLYGLGYWWSFWDRAHQTWHDKIAHTLVIDTRVSEPAAQTESTGEVPGRVTASFPSSGATSDRATP